MKRTPLCDYVIVDYKTPELAKAAERSLAESGVPHTVTMIDSSAGGLSYSQAVHVGMRAGSAPFVCALNADVECRDSQWPVLDLFEEDERIAVVGPRQVDEHGLIRHAGIVGTNVAPAHRFWGEWVGEVGLECSEHALDCVTVSGSVYYARRSVWEELGGFLRTPHYFEETWFSYLARHRGHRVVYTGESTWLHHWSRSPVENGWLQAVFSASQALFRQACSREGIECD